MKKLLLIIIMLTLVSGSPFTNTKPGETYAVWHVNDDGNFTVLILNKKRALWHLENHVGDWCHGGHCPY